MLAPFRIAAVCVVFAGAVAFIPALAADVSVPPVPRTYVTDGVGALSSQTAAALEDELKAYEKATGHQVVVWIGDTTAGVPLEDWTSTVAHAWGIGHNGKDDGVILFVFMGDRRARIEVGYGLEGALPDAKASEIMRNVIVTKMKSNDPDAAVKDGIASILTTITPSFAANVPGSDLKPSANIGIPVGLALFLGWLPFIVFFGIVILAIYLKKTGRLKPVHGGGGSGSGGWVASSGGATDIFGGVGDFVAAAGDFGGGGASGSW